MSEGFVDGVDVSWDEARATNLANWNDRVDIHVRGYGIEAFTDPSHLSQVVRTDLAVLERILPDGVRGLDVCHLQCHIGTDTVSLARAGAASVVGVDFSAPALAAARDLAEASGVRAEWVETDVLDARAAVSRTLGDERMFDLVYTSIGTITWLQDLDTWGRQVAALLKPGGTFYIRDAHPMLYVFDDAADGLVVKHRYFPNGLAEQWEEETSYVGEGQVAHSRTFEYPHSLAEIFGSLLGAGLQVVAFEEGRTLPWQYSPVMTAREDGDYELPAPLDQSVPLTFTLAARKPHEEPARP